MRLEFQRVLARMLGLFQIPGLPSPPKEIHVSVGQPRPGGSKLRINLDRSLEHLSRELDALTRPFVKKLTPAKIEFVRFDTRRGWLKKTTFFPLGQRETERLDNAAGDFVLDREDVFDLAIEAL